MSQHAESDPIYIVHLLTEVEGWVPLAQKGKAPYVFGSAAEAWNMANICYPDQCRSMRLGGKEQIRVTQLSPSRYYHLFRSPCTPEFPELVPPAGASA